MGVWGEAGGWSVNCAMVLSVHKGDHTHRTKPRGKQMLDDVNDADEGLE